MWSVCFYTSATLAIRPWMYRNCPYQMEGLWSLMNYSIVTFRQISREFCTTTMCRVQCVTWLVVRRNWWFQPGSSVQVVGPESTTGTWRQTLTDITPQPLSAWTRRPKWSKGWDVTVMEPYSTRSRQTVVARCLVPTTSMDGHSLVSSARSNTEHVRTHVPRTHAWMRIIL